MININKIKFIYIAHSRIKNSHFFVGYNTNCNLSGKYFKFERFKNLKFCKNDTNNVYLRENIDIRRTLDINPISLDMEAFVKRYE